MNETGHNSMHGSPRGRARRAGVRLGAVTAVLVAATLLVVWGCADKRTPPTAPPELGYTQTFPLWMNAVSGGNFLSAEFFIPQELAPIITPGVDTPAQLTVAAYVLVDGQMIRYEEIRDSLLPDDVTILLNLLIDSTASAGHADTLHRLDSICAAHPQSCPADSLARLRHDLDSTRAHLTHDSLVSAQARADTTVLIIERDSLAGVLDNRYVLSLMMDADTTVVYPEAVFRDAQNTLGGQGIFRAATNSATHMKGRGFNLPMDRFEAADHANLGLPLTVNWTTCFSGSTRPCLSQGSHTLHVRLTGAGSTVTGSLVVVYADRRHQ
jgi:hypothetical protein